MKTKCIDEFGDVCYYCDRCGETVYEFDDYCEICGNNLSSVSSFPIFSNREQGEDYYKNNKFKIMNIIGKTDSKYDKCLLVEANPIKLQYGGITFTTHICDDTIRFLYPDTQRYLSYLKNIAMNSLLEINFNEFEPTRVTFNGKSTFMYRHKDFFNDEDD